MMLAAKHFDPVLGIDIHIIQPPGPVPPLPIPHPFIGFLIDPFDYVPILGATVMVNGLPRAQAGTQGKAVPSHFPIGGTFVKPPGNECEMFMGSSTVSVDGDAFSHLVHPALSCQDIGMITPPRSKKKGKLKTLVLPTSVVLPIPGPPVTVGGPPTISLMAMGMKAGGAAFKRLAKTKAAGRAMAAFKKARQKVFKNMKPGFLKCKVLRAEPVDVTTGEVVVEQQDFALSGIRPLAWVRCYGSQDSHRGVCGFGWQTLADARLHFDADGTVLFFDGGPGASIFAEAPGDGSVTEPIEGCTLSRMPGGFRVTKRTGVAFEFVGDADLGAVLAIERIHDSAGHFLRFRRDAEGLQAIEDSLGRRVQARSSRGLILELSYSEAGAEPCARVRYEYDERDNLVTVWDALDRPYRFEYDGHLLVRHTNRNGVWFRYEYDMQSAPPRCVHTTGENRLFDYRFERDIVTGAVQIVDSLGQRSSIELDARGLPVVEVDARGARTTFVYDELGRTIAVTDALGRRTEWEYDESGHCVRMQLPGGQEKRFEYADGRLVRSIDACGAEWRWSYDDYGQLRERMDPLGRTVSLRWTAGRLDSVTNVAGRTTHISRDSFGHVLAIAHADGGTQRWSRDALGNSLSETDASGNRTVRTYDALGRLVEERFSDGQVRKLEFDPEGNVVRVSSGDRDVRMTYSGLNRLATVEDASGRIEYTYDTEDRLIAVTNQFGEIFHLKRDACGDVLEEIDFDGSRTLYRRDVLGRLVEVVRPSGRAVRYTYDSAGRVAAVKFDDGETRAYRYRQDGALLEASNGAASVRFERDALGRSVQEKSGDDWVASSFDAIGVRTETTSSLGLKTAATFSLGGELQEMRCRLGETDWSARFERSNGWERSIAFPGGTVTSTRDESGRLLAQVLDTVRERQVESRTYQWKIGPQLDSIQDAVRGAMHFRYHGDGTLTSAIDDDGSVIWRSSDPKGGGAQTVGAGGRVMRNRDTSFEYDRDGYLCARVDSSGDVTRYHWNADGTLREVELPKGSNVRFSYDALGRRIAKHTAERTVRYVWDGSRILHEAITRHALDGEPPSGAPEIVTWISEPFQHRWLARLDAAGACSIFSDHIGFPLRMVDGAGQTVWAVRRTLLGEATPFIRTHVDCGFRFPGQYADEETGLVYNRWRYYDPETGRYISKDPLGRQGGLDPYAYVPDPLRWIDPSGLQGEVTEEPFSIAGGSPDGPSPGHKGPRRGTDIAVDDAGNVKAQACDPANGVWPNGKSATVDPPRSRLTGTFYEVPAGTELPDGLAAVRDGAEVGGPHGPGHVTIYPTRDMPFEEFDAKVRSLPSEPKLKINDKGKITVIKCG